MTLNTDLNTWIANNMADYDVLEIGVSGLEFISSPGTNVVVTELVYDNAVLTGASESWYVTVPGQGGYQSMQ